MESVATKGRQIVLTEDEEDRPNNWEIIALHYAQLGKKNTIRSFQDQLGARRERSADQALRQLSLDLKSY
jgi:hypothetical protein